MHKIFITGSIFNAPLHPKTAFLGPLTKSRGVRLSEHPLQRVADRQGDPPPTLLCGLSDSDAFDQNCLMQKMKVGTPRLRSPRQRGTKGYRS